MNSASLFNCLHYLCSTTYAATCTLLSETCSKGLMWFNNVCNESGKGDNSSATNIGGNLWSRMSCLGVAVTAWHRETSTSLSVPLIAESLSFSVKRKKNTCSDGWNYLYMSKIRQVKSIKLTKKWNICTRVLLQ